MSRDLKLRCVWDGHPILVHLPCSVKFSWRHHQMETFSRFLALCEGNALVTGGFPSQRQVTRSFDVLFDQRLSKRLSKHSTHQWFDTPPRWLWRHCNDWSAQCLTEVHHEYVRNGKEKKQFNFISSYESLIYFTIIIICGAQLKLFLSHNIQSFHVITTQHTNLICT